MGNPKILVIQTAFLGDLLLSVPLLKNIRQLAPTSEIFLVCRQGFGSLLKDLKLVDRYFEVKKGQWSSYQKIIHSLHDTEFDVLFSPHESFTTARLALSLRAVRKVAFQKWWNTFFYKERVKKDLSLPDSLRQLSLLKNHMPELTEKLLSFKKNEKQWKQERLSPVPEWASPKVEIFFSPADLQTRFQLPARFVCLFPGSVWATKQWSEEGFAEAGQKLAGEGNFVVVMGGPGEETLAERVSAKISGSMSLAGKTSLFETLMILSRADLVITNDSAGQHLAALVEAPTISVFGPTVQKFGYRPWNSRAVIVERVGLLCRPCGKHGHHQCPIGTHECMKSISASEVLRALQSL